MTTAVAAAIRERARSVWRSLEEARRDNDAHAMLLAADDWDEVQRLARAHGVNLGDITDGKDDLSA
ncbi:hypothetical protein E1286_22725 [Nonomuraea terrae]|uniref:Uncharacterized protein n=1 Tax=Nonomuraea terrae TaxID=2530383 RepID=A0A4R4YLH4_9ACTN|nr:hypothetical protein [Nonomuraea terrae]TDD45868.1 hypothetical protein E1286_22725 [Nonomuraea terrae]